MYDMIHSSIGIYIYTYFYVYIYNYIYTDIVGINGVPIVLLPKGIFFSSRDLVGNFPLGNVC